LRSIAVYETRDAEEPAFQYVLDVPHVPSAVTKADALSESVLLIAETLESGSAMQQFEQLYRKKPGLSAEESKKEENVAKNRYRDISPCKMMHIYIPSKNLFYENIFISYFFTRFSLIVSGKLEQVSFFW